MEIIATVGITLAAISLLIGIIYIIIEEKFKKLEYELSLQNYEDREKIKFLEKTISKFINSN